MVDGWADAMDCLESVKQHLKDSESFSAAGTVRLIQPERRINV